MDEVYVVYQQCYYLGEPEAVFDNYEAAENWVKSQGGKVLGPRGDNGYHITLFHIRSE